MRIFYTKRAVETTVKMNIYRIFEALMLVFVMCVFGIVLGVQKNAQIQPNYEKIETVTDNVIFDIIELEFTPRTRKDELVSEYEKSSGDVSVFWELFEEKLNENNG